MWANSFWATPMWAGEMWHPPSGAPPVADNLWIVWIHGGY